MFYGYSDRLPMTRGQIAAARQVCESCPVRRDCLAEAVNDEEEWGVWGGYTPPERDRAIVEFGGDGPLARDRILAAYDHGLLDTLVVKL